MGFGVDSVAMVQVFSEYFGFPCQFSFHRLLHTHHLSSGAGKIDQILADVPSGLGLTHPKKLKYVGRAEHERKFRSILNDVLLKVHHTISREVNVETESSIDEM
jgi:hypothetical protein